MGASKGQKRLANPFVPVSAVISKPLQGDSCTNTESKVYWSGYVKIKDLMGNTPCSEVKWSKSLFFFVFLAALMQVK